METRWFMFCRYYLNHFKTVPESPTQVSNLSKSIVWSTVLNAALRFSSIHIQMLPESSLRRKSFTIIIIIYIYIRAMSVLRWGRNSDWKLSLKPLDPKKPLSCPRTTFSMSLLMKCRFDIGLSLSMKEASRLWYF